MNNARFLPLFVIAFVSACASVEEQKPAPAPQAVAPAPAPAPAARPAERQAVPSTPSTPAAPARAASAPAKGSVYFDYDKYDIKPEFKTVLEENARYLRENPALRAKVEGNADERGSREYNLALGQRRAEAVMKMMVLLGVPERRLEAVSYGEEKPRRSGHDEASWAENRRGDLVFEGGR